MHSAQSLKKIYEKFASIPSPIFSPTMICLFMLFLNFFGFSFESENSIGCCLAQQHRTVAVSVHQNEIEFWIWQFPGLNLRWKVPNNKPSCVFSSFPFTWCGGRFSDYFVSKMVDRKMTTKIESENLKIHAKRSLNKYLRDEGWATNK